MLNFSCSMLPLGDVKGKMKKVPPLDSWVQGSHLGSKDTGHLKCTPLSAEGHSEKLELA